MTFGEKLLKQRGILIGLPITDKEATEIIAKLLFLEQQSTNEPITIYINSPGGVVTAGIAILDTIELLKPKIYTVCKGHAHSLAAIILAAGSLGCRCAIPDAKISFSKVIAGSPVIPEKRAQTQRMERVLIDRTSRMTGMTRERTRSLFFTNQTLNAIEARDLGIIDEVETVDSPL
jgi:ATP-dependent Clp protease, protease subunit